MTTYAIDKFACRNGTGFELQLTDPMPSRDFAIEKLAAHKDSLEVGNYGITDIAITCDSPTRLGFHVRCRMGSQIVLWRIRNTERQPECVPVWANVIDQ